MPCAARRVEANPGSDRDVQAFDAALQRNADHAIARLACEPAKPRAFRTEYPRDRTHYVGIEETFAAGFGADDPNVASLEIAERSREIGDGDNGHRVGRAAGRLRDRCVDAYCTVLRNDQRVRAEGIGAAQTRAEVMWIGNAVEHQ